MDLEVVRELAQEAESKIVLFVMDGLGGLPHAETGRTELESAWTPHLDRIAKESSCGFTIPVATGITPGSGPGHLALFGYDPFVYQIGRGALEATGIDFELEPADIAARGNFCTVDGDGLITDRRAGRVSTEEASKVVDRLKAIDLPGVQTFVEPVREHRFVLALRGEGLSEEVSDTDPQREGVRALSAAATSDDGKATADLVNRWVEQAQKITADTPPANMLLLRGFARRPNWPSMPDVFRLRAASIAHYPMYRGLARLVGMETLPVGPSIEDSMTTLRENWDRYDYFFIHYKHTDAAGEDGDYDRKVEKIEEVDAHIKDVIAMEPDVLMVTGDHSTPAIMGAHSWHSVPFMMRSKWMRGDVCESFNEVECVNGSLGTIHAKDALILAMANAGRLKKFGA